MSKLMDVFKQGKKEKILKDSTGGCMEKSDIEDSDRPLSQQDENQLVAIFFDIFLCTGNILTPGEIFQRWEKEFIQRGYPVVEARKLAKQIREFFWNSPEFLTDRRKELLSDYLGEYVDDKRITGSFLKSVLSFFPSLDYLSQNPDISEADKENIFKQWMKTVKQYYPEDCQDDDEWLRMGYLLFFEYFNDIVNLGISCNPHQKNFFYWMFDRFFRAFDKKGGHK